MPALAAGVSPATGIALEAIMTVVLLLAVFGTAVDPRGPRIGGLAIGLAIAADILVGGPVTGAAMNPARWFGPAVASGFFDNALVWIVGPLLGAGRRRDRLPLAVQRGGDRGLSAAHRDARVDADPRPAHAPQADGSLKSRSLPMFGQAHA